jgi:hypothetical protein
VEVLVEATDRRGTSHKAPILILER